jgi:cytochrome oxidase assembly protein ShyY1
VGSLQAPHQIDGPGKESIWDVGLLQTDQGGVILVARGLWSERVNTSSVAKIELVGKLMPHQSEDYVESSKGVLRRLDSALVVGQTSADLYDGYVIAESESIDGVLSQRIHIEPPAPRSAVPGFYWQHLSYVIIWWFMAGVMLYLPFYQRRVSSKVESSQAQ